MEAASLIEVMTEAADAVATALEGLSDWGPAGTRPGQYRSDLVADDAAVRILLDAGCSVLSEESGFTEGPAGSPPLLAVLDPVDGSTNAARGIPWYATSICVLDDEGPLAAVVVNQASRRRYAAIRDEGAQLDGQPISPTTCRHLGSAVIGLSGYPKSYLGWKQYRVLGAVALDLCAVADGTLDGYVDCGWNAHGGWDYLGGWLICTEAGAVVADALGRGLDVRTHSERRAPVAGATAELLAALMSARQGVQ